MADVKTEAYGFYKTDQGYLINKDDEGLAAYKKQKSLQKKIKLIETELGSIKDDMSEIKILLRKLVE
jgi:hypothetical protein